MARITDNQSELDIFKKSKKISDMPQSVMNAASEVQIDSTAEVNMPVLEDPPTSEKTFSVGTVVPVADAWKSNKIRLSKYQQNRLKHQGVVEIPQTWETEWTYGLVVDSSSSAYESIPPEERPNIEMGKIEDGKVITANGTFTKSTVYISQAVYLNPYSNSSSAENTEPHESIIYNNDASSSSSSGTGLITPKILAAAADEEQFADKIIDLPGKTDGGTMDDENYLTIPGDEIVTSETYIGSRSSSSSP